MLATILRSLRALVGRIVRRSSSHPAMPAPAKAETASAPQHLPGNLVFATGAPESTRIVASLPPGTQSPTKSRLRSRGTDRGDDSANQDDGSATTSITPDILFEIKASLDSGTEQYLVAKLRSVLQGIQAAMPALVFAPYVLPQKSDGVERIGVWLHAPGHPQPSHPETALPRGVAPTLPTPLPPGRTPPDPEWWARGLAEMAVVLPQNANFLDFALLFGTTVLDLLSQVVWQSPTLSRVVNSKLGPVELTGLHPTLIAPNQVMAQLTGTLRANDLPDVTAFTLTLMDRLGVVLAANNIPGHVTCSTSTQIDVGTLISMLTDPDIISLIDFLPGLGNALADIVSGMPSVQSQIPQASGFGCAVATLVPTQFLLAGIGIDGNAHKLVFDYSDLAVDPQRGIIAFGSLIPNALRHPTVRINGPEEVEVPRQQGSAVSASYGITTSDLRAFDPPHQRLNVQWEAGAGVVIGQSGAMLTEATFDLSLPIGTPRTISVRVSDADGITAPLASIDVQLKPEIPDSTHTYDPERGRSSS